MNQSGILGTFETHPFLSELSERQRMILASGVEPFSAEAGERFVREGEPANAFYFIREGWVQIEASRGLSSTPLLVERLGPGDVVGWSWLLPPYRWQFSARAIDQVHGCYLDAAWLRDLCVKDCYLGQRLYKQLIVVLSRRLTALRRKRRA